MGLNQEGVLENIVGEGENFLIMSPVLGLVEI